MGYTIQKGKNKLTTEAVDLITRLRALELTPR